MERLKPLFKSLLLVTALACAPARADGWGSSLLGAVEPDQKECSALLTTANQVALAHTDLAAGWAGKLLHRLALKIGHNTISSLEGGESLATAGLSGHFLGDRKIEAFTTEANRVLTMVLADPVLAQYLGYQLVRLGLLPHDAKHFDFAKYQVLAKHETIDLQKPTFGGTPIEDEVVLKYLKTLSAQMKGSTTLSPERDIVREDLMSSIVKGSFDQLEATDVELKASLKSLDMAFIEIGRLQANNRLTPETFDAVFDRLHGSAEFAVREVVIPGWARQIAGVIPWSDIAFKVWDFASRTFYKESGLASVRREVDQTDIWHKRTPRSLRIRFATRDIMNINGTVSQFIAKYANNPKANVFSTEFANDFLMAYPETQEYFSSFYSAETLPTHRVAGDAFGNLHTEIQKILYKAANFLSVLHNDTSLFPDLDPTQLTVLHDQMVADLGLANPDGSINNDQIDLVFTTFVTNALGKAHSPLIDSISDDFGITDHVGNYDADRRALFLLHHYRTLSYSFSRQSVPVQKFITEIMDHNYQSNLRELLRLEAPPASFDILHQMDASHLTFIFYQHLLSESKESHHQMTIAPHVLSKWMNLKALLVRDTNANVTSWNAYQTYLGWLQSNSGLNLQDEWDQVILRVGTMMGLPGSEMPALKQEMDLLNGQERTLFTLFFQRRSVFFHHGADVFKVLMMANSKNNLPVTTSMDEFLTVINSILTSIQNDHFTYTMMANTGNTVHLFMKPIVESLQDDGADPSDLARRGFDLHHYSYGYVVRPFEANKR